MHHSTEPSLEKGFTLIEILVALLILSIGLTSVFLLFTQALSVQEQSIGQTDAVHYAHSLFAETQSRLNQGAISIPSDGLESRGELNSRYRYQLHMTPVPEHRHLYRTEVTVFWNTQGNDQKQTFKTVLRPQ